MQQKYIELCREFIFWKYKQDSDSVSIKRFNYIIFYKQSYIWFFYELTKKITTIVCLYKIEIS